MVQLVLVFCLSASPSDCREERPMMDLTMTGCMVQGQQIASGWLSEHPNWSLSRWRCENNIPKQKQI